jgi:hypothetical protein
MQNTYTHTYCKHFNPDVNKFPANLETTSKNLEADIYIYHKQKLLSRIHVNLFANASPATYTMESVLHGAACFTTLIKFK